MRMVEWAKTKIGVISGQRAPRAKSNFGFPTEREVVEVLKLFGERLSYLPRAAAAAAGRCASHILAAGRLTRTELPLPRLFQILFVLTFVDNPTPG